MNLVFDTSVLIEIERKNKFVIDKIKKYIDLYPLPAQITFINYFEFYHGLKNKEIKNKEKALSFVSRFGIIKITNKTAEILSDLKSECESNGNILPLADLLVASQVLEHNLILVTTDKDFERIKKLNKIIL